MRHIPRRKSRNVPASASPFWITTVLRKQIGYRGLILSDDLEMGGILKFMPIEEAAVAAVRAGSDLLEICHSAELILRALRSVDRGSGEVGGVPQVAAAARHAKWRASARELFKGIPRALTAKQFETLRERVNRFREKSDAT